MYSEAGEGNTSNVSIASIHKMCQHFVQRKKRLCRMIPVKGGKYCGEHLPVYSHSIPSSDDKSDQSGSNLLRITCPLDPKHTIYASKLTKHLKICNAARSNTAAYIVPGLNIGGPAEDSSETDFRLIDIDSDTIGRIIQKACDLYTKYDIDQQIEDLFEAHPVLADEMNKPEYGHSALKHLTQISAILGYLEYFKQFDDYTSYVEYGAGKGQVSFWLAKCLTNYSHSNVLLIDRASLRHKRDNKLADTHAVERIRVDIADFDITKYDSIQQKKRIVAMGKHLCGGATDLAIRCILHGNNTSQSEAKGPKTNAIFIALCCHHRCTWNTFTGKDFFIENGIDVRDFRIITKMAGWATCGTGFSRERRKLITEETSKALLPDNTTEKTTETEHHDDPKSEDAAQELVDQTNQKIYDFTKRKEIGDKCKRIIDYARVMYLQQNGYKCAFKRYVGADITPENICLVALLE